MAQALFINSEYLKSVSVIDENVDEKIIRLSIVRAQRLHIKPKLGTDLYNKFVTDINAGTPITGVYKTLLDEYIIPALVEWSVYEATLGLNFKYRNKAIAAQSSENAQPADLTILSALKDDVKIPANQLTEDLVRYLCNNSSSYPEYESNNDDGDLPPNNVIELSPIWLGRGNCGCNYKDETIDLN